MLTQERHDMIINYLSERNTAAVSDLADMLDTSESTVRRDLTALDRMGRLRKVHGGATAIKRRHTVFENDVLTKSTMNTAEKQRIGRAAAALIGNDDFVFIDAGTTTSAMIDHLNEGLRATFVTNGIVHAKKLIQKGFQAYIMGGQIKLTTEAVVGTETVANLRKYNFTKTFIGTNGISVESGYTTPDAEEAAVKAEAMKRGRRNYVLADHSKFDLTCSVTFGDLSEGIIITDEPANNKFRKHTIIREAEA